MAALWWWHLIQVMQWTIPAQPPVIVLANMRIKNTRLQYDWWWVSDSGSVRAQQPTANRTQLKHTYLSHTEGVDCHGWNMEIPLSVPEVNNRKRTRTEMNSVH